MLRRSFVAAAGGLCLAPAAAAVVASRADRTALDAPLLRTVVTNLPATLFIAAFTIDGQRLGYLPGRPTRVITALMDRGVEVEALVVTCRSVGRPAVTVDVSLTGGGVAASG